MITVTNTIIIIITNSRKLYFRKNSENHTVIKATNPAVIIFFMGLELSYAFVVDVGRYQFDTPAGFILTDRKRNRSRRHCISAGD
jgi:hypothetical protein